MELAGKSVVIYGASNPIGSSFARRFAKEGATVYLAGSSTRRLQGVAREILTTGGAVEVAQVDPLDAKSVSEHLHQVAVKHGTVDFSLNVAFLGIQGATRLCNLTDEQFAAATFTRVRSNFVTMAAAAREMAYQGRGTILAASAPEQAAPVGTLAGEAIGNAAIEGLCQQLRIDVGSFGVRIAYLAEPPAPEEELIEQLAEALPVEPKALSSSGEMVRAIDLPIGYPRAEAPASLATS